MRAIARWAWRMFRREWRQQVLVLALLTVAVAGATFLASLAYNADGGSDGEFGTARSFVRFSGADPSATARDVATAEEMFGTVDVVSSWSARVDGTVERLEIRHQDPDGPYRGKLDIVSGRYPTGRGEVAVSPSVADALGLGVGATLELDRGPLPIVGVVENAGSLDESFAIVGVPLDRVPDSVSILIDADDELVGRFRERMTVRGNVLQGSRGDDQQRALSVIFTFGLSTIGLLLVALIAAAGFVVLAQRRLRQLGMLAAVGATERQVRWVTLANGAFVGVVAAVLGTSLGVATWMGLIPTMENVIGHRFGGFNVPLWLVATSAVLAVATAMASAWWPARAVARIPVTQALSARPAKPQAVHRSVVAAVVLVAGGILCFALADRRNALLVILGTLATPIGVLLLAPLAIRAVAPLARRLPVASRLALRDLARHQARSGAALAAISLALGIQASVLIVASADEARDTRDNLAETQLVVRIGESGENFILSERTPAELAQAQAEVDEFVATLGGATVVPLTQVIDEGGAGKGVFGPGEMESVLLAAERSPDDYDALPFFVATPELLARYGVGAAELDTHDYFSVDERPLLLLKRSREDVRPVDVGRLPDTGYTDVPGTFISPGELARLGFESVPAGWFIETDRPFTDDELTAARSVAGGAGLTVAARHEQGSNEGIRTWVTAIGTVLALGILAMTVGLIRAEGAADVRTLTATGASSRVRRSLTAATAGVLASLGAVLGIIGAYLAMTGAYLSSLDQLGHVPWLNLTITVVGVPLVAWAAGWLLAGREPPAFARSPLT